MSSYIATDWVDGVTPLNEANMDKIESELVLLDSRKVPSPSGQDGKWLTVTGGAMVWAAAPAGGGGGGLDWEGAYGAGVPYVKGDVVTYNGVTYGAVNDSTGQTPPAASPFPVTNVPVALVTALPSSPFDGQECVLTDSLTAPTYQWHLRYIAAKATNKWVFLGGSPSYTMFTPDETTTSVTTWVDLATVGPQFTTPVAGDWACDFGAVVYHSVATAGLVGGVALGATTPISPQPGAYAGSYAASLGGIVRHLGIAAGGQLRVRYMSNVAGTAHFSNRWLSVLPIAVGG